MDNVTAGLHRPRPFLFTVKYAWNAFLSSQNGLCQVDSLTAPPANATPSVKRQDRALCAEKTKQLTAHGPVSTVCTASKAPRRRTGHGRRPCLAKGARAPGDEATVACQKGGMYPTFDSAAGSGEIPVFFGILPYLILRVTWFDSASGPIPVNIPHCPPRAPPPRACSVCIFATVKNIL